MAGKTRLGSFIRECRTGLKYTSREVSRLAADRPGIPSISNSYLISVENGKHIPRLDKVIALAEVLNVPVTHLVDCCREDIGNRVEAPDAAFDELLQAAIERSEMNDHTKALEMFRQAQQKAAQLNGSVPRSKMFELRLQMANSYRCLKISRVAKEEIEGVLRAPDLDDQTRTRAAYILSEIYRDEGSSFLGLTVARETLRLAREIGDEVIEARLLSTLGKFALQNGEFDEALSLYREAAVKMKQLGRSRSALLARISQGLLMVEKREYFKAVDLLRTELTDCKENDPYVRGSLHIGLAKAYYGAENYRSSRTHARSARDCAEKLSDPSLLFLSVYYLWQVARRERAEDVVAMHFERLKYYRNKIDVTLIEVEKFDRYVKQTRDRAAREASS